MIAKIDMSTIVGLRDRALIGIMVNAFARVGAVVAMNFEDYFPQGKRWWFRLHEKGGKLHEMPAHHKAEEYLDEYSEAVGTDRDKKYPLFRTVKGKNKEIDGGANVTTWCVLHGKMTGQSRRFTAGSLLPFVPGQWNHQLFGQRRYTRESATDG